MRLRAVASLAALLLSSGAFAADAPGNAPVSPWYMQPLALVSGTVRSVGSAAGSVWSSLGSYFSADPTLTLPAQLSEDDRRFFGVLDAMGLQLSEIKIGSATLSHPSYRFVAAREPSDVDIERTMRRLDDYRANSGGLRSGAKQRIAQSVLDLAVDRGFVVTAIVVELSPWPSVSYEIGARSRPLEAGERRVVEAAQPQ